MRTPLKIILIVLFVLLTCCIIALSRWEIPAPSIEVIKTLSTDKTSNKAK